MTKQALVLGALLLGLTACAKDDVTVDSAVDDPTWAEMDGNQRSAYMASDVTPAMSTLFQAYDSEAYSSFGCGTCHGPEAVTLSYAMPVADLPMLNPAEMPTVDSGPTAKFMIEQVLPAIRTQLEDDTLTCFTCHTEE